MAGRQTSSGSPIQPHNPAPSPKNSVADDGHAEVDHDGAEQQCFVIRRDIRRRVDQYLRTRLKGISRSRVQKLIDAGGVMVNGRQPKSSTTIRQGDRIDIVLPPPAIRVIQPEPITLDILHEDEWFVVVNKQADLIVHPARSQLRGTLVNGLAHHFMLQQQQQGRDWKRWQTRGFRPQDKKNEQSPTSTVGEDDLRPGIVHRLDKHTTGAIVVAKNDEAHWNIASQFQNRCVHKTYLALVHGIPDEPAGVIDVPIGKHPTYREPYAVRFDSSAKASVTVYRTRERYRGYSLLELELKTGRTHQLRVHLSYIGCPIVGDIWYGGEPVGLDDLKVPSIAAGARRYLNSARDKEQGQRIEEDCSRRDDLLMCRPALHAARLGFDHPKDRQFVAFTAPMHEPMVALVNCLRQIDKSSFSRIEAPSDLDMDVILPSTTTLPQKFQF